MAAKRRKFTKRELAEFLKNFDDDEVETIDENVTVEVEESADGKRIIFHGSTDEFFEKFGHAATSSDTSNVEKSDNTPADDDEPQPEPKPRPRSRYYGGK